MISNIGNRWSFALSPARAKGLGTLGWIQAEVAGSYIPAQGTRRSREASLLAKTFS
jgi:hypothetical protein